MQGLQKKITSRLLGMICIIAALATIMAAPARAAAPLTVTLGKADIIHLSGQVSDILVANPSVVEVQAVQADTLYVVGLNVGDTNIIVLDAQGDVIRRMDVHVTYDIDAIQSMIKNLFPKEKVKVGAIHDQIVLTGSVSNPEKAAKISNLVAHYVSDLQDLEGNIDYLISNLLEVRGEQQVMLQVKIVEASRTILKELGIEAAANDPDELAASTILGKTRSTSLTNHSNSLNYGAGDGLALSESAIGVAGLILNSGVAGLGNVGLFLDALEEESLVNVLAEPNLTAVSGQQAGFLAGGEIPVPSGRDSQGNITVEFRKFGVSLNFKPIVLSENRLSLQLNTEVSSLDNSNSVVLSGVTVPGLDVRRADTTVEMPSGGSLMIAGLLQSKSVEGANGLPGIKDTPIIGDLISSDSFRRDETEMVVIVTAYLVKPYADGEERKKPEPKEDKTELAQIFKTNIRRQFKVKNELFAQSEKFGYLLD